MKTLKFRFYDKTLKQMRFFDGIWNMPDPDYDFDGIQQFTGLLDKQGKEIYESDIVNVISKPIISMEPAEKAMYEIYWNAEWCGWQGRNKGLKICSNPLWGLARFDVIEIIGNTYETPELIK